MPNSRSGQVRWTSDCDLVWKCGPRHELGLVLETPLVLETALLLLPGVMLRSTPIGPAHLSRSRNGARVGLMKIPSSPILVSQVSARRR
jgi:hypothetical protein